LLLHLTLVLPTRMNLLFHGRLLCLLFLIFICRFVLLYRPFFGHLLNFIRVVSALWNNNTGVISAFLYRPLVWSLVDFVPASAYQSSDFSKFSLLPAPENDKQSTEWQKFMHYLWDSKKVHDFWILQLPSYKFYIVRENKWVTFWYI
jgi:hypothetical protein